MEMTLIGGFFSLLYWIVLSHLVTKFYSKYVRKVDLEKDSAINFTWNKDKKYEVMSYASEIVEWLKRILYGKSLKELFMTVVTCFILGKILNRMSNTM